MLKKLAVICILLFLLGLIAPIHAQDSRPLTPPYREILLPDHGTVSAVAWNHDVANPVLAVAVDAPAVLIWDIAADEVLNKFPLDHLITVLDWSADDQHLLAGTELGDVLSWEVASGEVTTIATLPRHIIRTLQWSQTAGEVLIAATVDEALQVYRWDVFDQAPLLERTLEGPDLTTAPVWSHDETRLLVGDLFGVVRVWDITTTEITWEYADEFEAMILGLTWSEDDSQILFTPISGRVYAVSITGEPIKTYEGGNPEYDLTEGGTWNADETLVLAGSNTGTGSAYGWDAATGELIFELEIGQVLFNTFRVNGGTLLTAAQSDFENGTTIRVWDFAEYVVDEQ